MKELQQLLTTYKNAVYQKDLEAFVSIFDDNIRVFDMWEKWSYRGIAEWKEMTKGWFDSLGKNRDLVTFNDVEIQTGEEISVLSAIVKFTAESESGEELRFLENRLTWVVQKKENAWKIIHQHTSGPIDFETMKVILKR